MSLTETSYLSRNVIKYIGVFLVGYVILRYVYIGSVALYRQLNPPPPPPPTAGFGPLPVVRFPEQEPYDLLFNIQTPTGQFPQFADRVYVFYIPFQRARFSALDEAKRLASGLGFSQEPMQLTSEVYEWRVSDPHQRLLEQNIVNGTFTYSYQWRTDRELLTNQRVPGKEETIRSIEQARNRMRLALEDINLDGGEISYLSATGNRLVPAVSPSEADFVSVELYRNDVSFLDPVTEEDVEYDVVTADDQRGIISMIFSSSTRADKKLISVEFDYFPVNYDQRHTYLLKSVPEAWEELKNGMGYIALNEDEEANTIFIRRVELAYYDSYTAQEFLQPIYIFRGDNGGNGEFVAYVSAIHSSHIQQGR